MAAIGNGCEYFKSLPGIMKILEFIVLIIALASVGYFFNNMVDNITKKDNLKFFLAVICLAWVLVMAFWLFFVSGLHLKINAVNWPITHGVIFSIWAVLLLISSSFMADAVKSFEDSGFCELIKAIGRKERCGHLIAGTVFGFIAIILFIVDAVIHFMMKEKRASSSTTTTVTVE